MSTTDTTQPIAGTSEVPSNPGQLAPTTPPPAGVEAPATQAQPAYAAPNTTVNVHLPVNFAPTTTTTVAPTTTTVASASVGGATALVGGGRFQFDGGAADYLGMQILSTLLIVCTLGLATPWAVCMRYRWRAEHTIVDGHRLRFTGRGSQLAGDWLVTLLLLVVTCGIYGFWVAPRFTRFEVEHQSF